MVVERQPVDHLIHGLAPRGEALAIQPADFQAAPQALGRDIVPAVGLARALGLTLLNRAMDSSVAGSTTSLFFKGARR